MKKSQSSDYFNRLEKSLGVDKEGNLTAGKNLEVEGTTKLIDGFTFIHTYPVSSTQNINIMFEKLLNGSGYYGFVGTLIDDLNEFICIGTYLDVGAPYKVVSLMFIDNSDLDKVKYAKGMADGNPLTLSNFTIS